MEESREDLIQMQVKGWQGTLHQIDLLADNDQRIYRRIQIEHEVLYSIAGNENTSYGNIFTISSESIPEKADELDHFYIRNKSCEDIAIEETYN